MSNRYPMLGTRVAKESDYVSPQNYERLLKEYSFAGRADLDIFRDAIDRVKTSRGSVLKALELGCGTGRVTDVVLKNLPNVKLDLLDLSPYMLDHVRGKYGKENRIGSLIESDTIAHLESSREIYDLIFSLWSFSHSVHQILDDYAFEKDKNRVKKAIQRMCREMLERNGKFFLIHFDGLSDEQKILIQQWAKDYPMFENDGEQTPSKLLIDEAFKELQEGGDISFSSSHHLGDPIIYRDMSEALDIFLNFHLESSFNERPNSEEIAIEIEEYLKQFERANGTVAVRPGCFSYEVTKL